MKPFLPLFAILIGLSFAASAANFTVSSGTDTTAKTLAAGETGTVASGAALSISGGTNAITLSATTGTTMLTNSGDILQTGTGRAVRHNASGTPSFTITNDVGALIRSADGDTLRADAAGSNWTVNNHGTIRSLNASAGGSQAIDLDAITTGAVRLSNFATGSILANFADAIRPGANAIITNSGTISATPDSAGSGSDGIDTQGRSGVEVLNTGSIGGRHGITGNSGANPYTLTVTNNGGGVISAENGSGINTDGPLDATNQVTVNNAQGATIQGGILSTTAMGDGDGVDVDGVLTLDNAGDILALGSKGAGGDGLPNNPDAIAMGGGSIINRATGRIIGSSLASDAPNGDTTRDGHGILVDNSSGGSAIAATSITNSGLIQGKTGYGVRIIGDFADTITNHAGGIIRGANNSTVSPVIQLGGGNDTLTNAGTISHDGGGGQTAIAMEAGDDTVTITGPNASITGGIDGGSGGETNGDTLKFDLGTAGNTFSYDGAISNFESVQALSGHTILGGDSAYLGSTSLGGTATAARLELNGSLAGTSGVSITSSGTLAGTGSLSLNNEGSLLQVQVNGSLAPGGSAERGRLTLGIGSVALDGQLVLTFDGSAAGSAGGYDQFRMSAENTGTFALGATSSLSLTVNISPAEGAIFTVVDIVNSAGSVAGTFAGLAEGAEFDAGGSRFRISYAGGADRNDITLTAVPEPGSLGLSAAGAVFLLVGRRRLRARIRSLK